MNMYRKIDVWMRKDTVTAMRFQCLERLSDGLYAVQNVDYFGNAELQSVAQQSFLRFVELFFDEDPSTRCEWVLSIEEAISKYLADFAGMPGDS